LVVFYSRTGTTKKIAEAIAKGLKADTERIEDVKSRLGIFGYLRSGREAAIGKPGKIKPTNKDPDSYDLIILGTPVWAYKMSSPMRAYISQNRKKFRDIAFFCTMGGSGNRKVFASMKKLTGKKPKALLSLKTKEVMQEDVSKQVSDFVRKLK